MNILIAYDGSEAADAAIEDLARAGLPEDASAMVICVGEIWLPAGNGSEPKVPDTGGQAAAVAVPVVTSETAREAETLGRHAAAKLRSLLPGWTVESEARSGSPAYEILSAAQTLDADLIVLGSKGTTAGGRHLIGSIAQKVLTEANCSVRIGRRSAHAVEKEVNVLIGFDGSPGAEAAVDAVAMRNWPDGCRIFLVTATTPLMPSTIGRFIPPVVKWVKEELEVEKQSIRQLAERAFSRLESAGCKAKLVVANGNPKQLLVEKADELRGDCIFVGAHSYTSDLEKFLIGSTSAAVASRSACSVEVVRRTW